MASAHTGVRDWRWKSLAAIAPAILLCAVAMWEIAASSRAGAWEPTEGHWRGAVGAVEAEFRQGDLIVFAPRWIDPLGRHYFGNWISLEMAGRMDADRYGTIWEISVRGARAPETRGLTPSTEGHFGGVVVRRYVRDPVVVLTDFVAATEARKGRAGGKTAGGPKVSLEEVGFEPHRCIRIVPHPNQTGTLEFTSVSLGRTLVGYVGLADVFTRRDVRDPGRFEVVIDGRTVSETTVGVDDGWVRFEVATEPKRASVEFRATAVGPKAKDRRICFAAEARK